MREIKFRGKNPELGGWAIGYYASDVMDDGNTAYVMVTPNGSFCVDPKTVGQFTGLIDKNGVEIYEGDIVRAHSMAIEDNPSNNVVKFENGSFRYNSEPKADVPCGCYKSSEVEVIGNIHDNPELLEVLK